MFRICLEYMHVSALLHNDDNRLGTKSVRRQIPLIRMSPVLLLLGCIGLCLLDPCEIMRAVSFQLRRWLMMVNDWVVQLSVGFVFFTSIVDSFFVSESQQNFPISSNISKTCKWIMKCFYISNFIQF